MDQVRATICALCLMTLGASAVAQDGAAASADARVKVTMTNGSIIMGIARGGVLSERQLRDGFKPAKNTGERSTGIRVWYYQRMNGFLFLPHHLVEEVEVLSILTPEQSAAVTGAKVKDSGTAAKKPGRIASGKSPTGSAVQGKEASWTPPRKLAAAQPRSILDEFPPDKGWGKDRLGEIRRRESVEGIAPTAEERRFVEVYEKWDRAHRAATQKPIDPAVSKPLAKPRKAPKLDR